MIGDAPVVDLRPLFKTLAANKARSTLAWLRRGSTTQVLRDIVSGKSPCTHETIDRLPQNVATQFLRNAMLMANLLPQRAEAERLQVWLDCRKPSISSEDKEILTTFCQWILMRRTREASERGRLRTYSIQWAMSRVRATETFLNWLFLAGKSFSSITQGDLDSWLAENTSTGYLIRSFVVWATDRRFAIDLEVPERARLSPGEFMADETWADAVSRLLNDTGIDRDLRLIGLLVLLFGLHLSRLTPLNISDLSSKSNERFLSVGSEAIPLPPKLVPLIDAQIAFAEHNPRARRPDGTILLFPGRFFGRPIGAKRLGQRLKACGFGALSGRNSAMANLSKHIEPVVLAELLGIHVNTAVKWTSRYGASGRVSYLARRIRDSRTPSAREN